MLRWITYRLMKFEVCDPGNFFNATYAVSSLLLCNFVALKKNSEDHTLQTLFHCAVQLHDLHQS